MSEFADIFSSKLEEASEGLERTLEPGFSRDVNRELSARLEEIFQRKTISEKESGFEVIGCDAGRNDIEFRNNTRFYLVRAAAVDSTGEAVEKMDIGALRPYRGRDYEEFMRRTSEKVEIEAVMERLEGEDFKEDVYVLIDGTLLTRLLVTPKELELSERKAAPLELIRKFQELLELAENKENLTVVGVSKDSNSGVLFRKVMQEIIDEEIDKLEGKTGLEPEDLENLKEEYRKVRYAPSEVREVLDNLEKSDELEEVRELIHRYRMRYSDTEILEKFVEGGGFTRPLQVGALKQSFFESLNEIDEDAEGFVERNFSTALEEDDSLEKEVIISTLRKLLDSPGVASFYWVPENDTPLRLDLLSTEFEEGRNLRQLMQDQESQGFLEATEKVEDILELIETGYAGEGMHNIWISEADNRASLPKSEVENVYKPLLEQKLGTSLREYMRRRDKRV